MCIHLENETAINTKTITTTTDATPQPRCTHIHPIRQSLRFQEFGILHFNYDENTSQRKFGTFVSRVVQITKERERENISRRKKAHTKGDIKKRIDGNYVFNTTGGVERGKQEQQKQQQLQNIYAHIAAN